MEDERHGVQLMVFLECSDQPAFSITVCVSGWVPISLPSSALLCLLGARGWSEPFFLVRAPECYLTERGILVEKICAEEQSSTVVLQWGNFQKGRAALQVVASACKVWPVWGLLEGGGQRKRVQCWLCPLSTHLQLRKGLSFWDAALLLLGNDMAGMRGARADGVWQFLKFCFTPCLLCQLTS